MLRQSIMADPAWNGGNYTTPPEIGLRLLTGWLSGIIIRTPAAHKGQFPNNLSIVPWLQGVRDGGWQRMDANDWIYQSWAIDQYDLGMTPGVNGDYYQALRTIKAKTLIMAGAGDLLTPEEEAREAAQYIPDGRYISINPPNVLGHIASIGITAPESAHLNLEISKFLESGTDRRTEVKGCLSTTAPLSNDLAPGDAALIAVWEGHEQSRLGSCP
jgi:homoserine O-acetyltransferase